MQGDTHLNHYTDRLTQTIGKTENFYRAQFNNNKLNKSMEKLIATLP